MEDWNDGESTNTVNIDMVCTPGSVTWQLYVLGKVSFLKCDQSFLACVPGHAVRM